MQVVQLQCPHCSTRLRLRDHTFVGRTIHCPDCAQPVSILRNAAGVIEASPRPAGDSTTEATGSEPAVVRPSAVTSTAPATMPQRIGWAVAALLVAVLLLVVFRGGDPSPSQDVTLPAPVPPSPDEPAPSPPAVGANPPEDAREDVAAATSSLAQWVVDYRDRHGHYPAENPLARQLAPESRLGWLATLAAQQDAAGPQPLWDQPLSSPLNSRFVNRRMPAFLNPSAGAPAAGGLPATHYAGMAGVGAGAAALPKDDPRAGIFGEGRSTSIVDVRDGLANTILLIGIAGDPAPWAAGGAPTMRGVTQEPYVNGPDGFGTGQVEGMYVAMADGSVRFLARELEPVLMRRMAAMADGLPLDAAVPGEPGDPPPRAMIAQPVRPPEDKGVVTEAPPVVADATADMPIEPLLAPDRVAPPPPTYNVERALAQPIVRFSQVRPIPFRVMLRQIEELAGVPIRLSEEQAPAARLLDREVSLELSETTVEEILATITESVGLKYETGEAFGIRLVAPGG